MNLRGYLGSSGSSKISTGLQLQFDTSAGCAGACIEHGSYRHARTHMHMSNTSTQPIHPLIRANSHVLSRRLTLLHAFAIVTCVYARAHLCIYMHVLTSALLVMLRTIPGAECVAFMHRASNKKCELLSLNSTESSHANKNWLMWDRTNFCSDDAAATTAAAAATTVGPSSGSAAVDIVGPVITLLADAGSSTPQPPPDGSIPIGLIDAGSIADSAGPIVVLHEVSASKMSVWHCSDLPCSSAVRFELPNIVLRDEQAFTFTFNAAKQHLTFAYVHRNGKGVDSVRVATFQVAAYSSAAGVAEISGAQLTPSAVERLTVVSSGTNNNDAGVDSGSGVVVGFVSDDDDGNDDPELQLSHCSCSSSNTAAACAIDTCTTPVSVYQYQDSRSKMFALAVDADNVPWVMWHEYNQMKMTIGSCASETCTSLNTPVVVDHAFTQNANGKLDGFDHFLPESLAGVGFNELGRPLFIYSSPMYFRLK